MRKIVLGRTGFAVSAVGLGGVQLGKITKREAARVIRTGLDLGINFFETGHGYFDSEEKIGYALRGKTDGVCFATKSGVSDAKTFTAHVDESLKRLRADVIHIYQLHGVDDLQQLKKAFGRRGAVEAAHKAIRQGKIRSLGITSHLLEVCLHVLERDLFDTIQYPISLINTEVPRSGMLGRARSQKVGLIAMKPLGGGRITDARLALGYIYRHPRVVPVVGVETCEQVRQLARIADRPPRMGPRQYERIREIRRTLGKTFCRACRYCEPCPQDIPIYQCLYFPIYLKQFGKKQVLRKGVPAYLKQAENCTACRQCEERCPFHLHIVDGLKENLALARRLAGSTSVG